MGWVIPTLNKILDLFKIGPFPKFVLCISLKNLKAFRIMLQSGITITCEVEKMESTSATYNLREEYCD